MIMAGREIILGLEDSPASLAALRWTARYAHATGAVLRAVHVLDWPIGLTASATGPGTRLQVPEEEVALPYRRGMHRVFNEVESHSGWALQFAHGRVPEVLVRLAEEACLLVVGTQQPTRANRYPADSVSHYCISHAICPVVTVPAVPATGTGEPCGGYRVQKSAAVSAAAYGVGEAGTSDRHVEACLPLEFGGRMSHVE
jgi:nucleotide-binding universal stress UspA family protein